MTNCFSHMKLFAVRFFHITFIFVKGRQMSVLDYSYLNLFSLFALPASHKNNPAKLVVKSKPSSRVCMFSKSFKQKSFMLEPPRRVEEISINACISEATQAARSQQAVNQHVKAHCLPYSWQLSCTAARLSALIQVLYTEGGLFLCSAEWGLGVCACVWWIRSVEILRLKVLFWKTSFTKALTL